MSNVTLISQLPAATSVSATDIVPITQGSTGPGTGTTAKATMEQIGAYQTGSVSVLAHGAKGDNTTDDTAAIQSAITAAAGGVCVFPPLAYKITGPILLPAAGITIFGYGASINPIKAVPGTYPAASGTFATLPGAAIQIFYTNFSVLTKCKIIIAGLNFNPVTSVISGATRWAGHAIHLNFVQDAIVRDVTNYYCDDTIAFPGCKNTIVEGCRSYYAYNCAYDHWSGFSNAIVRDNYAYSCGSDVNVNAIGSSTSDTFTSVNMLIDGNTFEYCAGASVFVAPLGTSANVQKVKITNNNFLNNKTLNSSGGSPQGVNIQAATHVILSNNTFDGYIGSPVYAATDSNTSHTSQFCHVVYNNFRNSTLSVPIITCCGPHGWIEGNIADESTVTAISGIQVDDPTTYVGPNDLGTVTYQVVNGHAYGGSTVAAMEWDADRTAYVFRAVQAVEAPVMSQSVTAAFNLAGTNAATATPITTALTLVSGGNGGLILPAVGTGSGLSVQCPVGSEWLVYNHSGVTATIYVLGGVTLIGAGTLANGSFARFVPFTSAIWVQA